MPDMYAADSVAYPDDADKFTVEARLFRMERYAEWYAAPALEREPATKKAMAELLGVSAETLRDYESDPRFQRKLMELIGSTIKVHKLPDVINALYAQASDPQHPRSVQAANTLLRWIEDTTPKDTKGALEDMSLEELRAELERRVG